MRCVPLKGMENKYAYLAERCTSSNCTLTSPRALRLSSILFFFFYPSPLSFFMAAIVPFHHIIG